MKKQKGKNQKWEFTRKDYRKYQFTVKEAAKYLLEGAVICAAVDYLFYQSLLVLLFMLPLPVLFQKLRRPAHLLLSDAGLLPRRLLRLAHGISPLPFVQNSFPVLTSSPSSAGSFLSCCTFPCNTGNFSRFHRLTSIFSGSSCTGSAVSTRRGGMGRAMHRYRLSSAT